MSCVDWLPACRQRDSSFWDWFCYKLPSMEGLLSDKFLYIWYVICHRLVNSILHVIRCRNMMYIRPNDEDNYCISWAPQIGRVTRCLLGWLKMDQGQRTAPRWGDVAVVCLSLAPAQEKKRVPWVFAPASCWLTLEESKCLLPPPLTLRACQTA